MDGAVGGSGILDAQRVVVVAAVKVVVEFSIRAAVFKARTNRVITAAIHFRRAAVLKRAALGLDVNDARRAETVLRRQRAGNELHGVNETRIKFEAETGNAFRQQHVVDAILQVRVFAANVQAIGGGVVLRHAGRAQDHLAERRVATLRGRVNLLFCLRVSRRAEIRHNLAAGFVKLADNRDISQVGDVRGTAGVDDIICLRRSRAAR